jgi:hypothetical protein
LVAGLVINISEYILNGPLLGAEMTAAMAERNLPPPAGSAIAVFVLLGFVLGVLLVWLYAAIRPRLGPGPKTAAIAGVVVWFLAYFWSTVGFGMLGVFPGKFLMIGLVWGLVELVIAGLVGTTVLGTIVFFEHDRIAEGNPISRARAALVREMEPVPDEAIDERSERFIDESAL